MRRLLAISALVLAACLNAAACAFEGNSYNNYMFSIIPRQLIGNDAVPPYAARLSAYWQQYCGISAAGQWQERTFFADHAADIAKAAAARHDAEMTAYLKLFGRYMTVSNSVSAYGWDYPTITPSQRRAALTAVGTAAAAYKGHRLRPQYTLLAMRANMLMGNDSQNVRLWNTTASRLADSPWRDAMRGIYARALLKAGRILEACDTYAALDDWKSMRWAMRNYRCLAGIKAVYAKNANSPSLTYLVQDFVNNVQETIDQQPSYSLDDLKAWMQEIDARTVLRDEARAFTAFAAAAAAGGKTEAPCMWESAAAMVAYLTGDQHAARTHADRAAGMKGTQRMRDNARAIRLLVSTRDADAADPRYAAYAAAELQWLDSMATADRTDPATYANHYTDVKERVVHQGLMPLYRRAGNGRLALALHAMSNADSNDYELRRAQAAGDKETTAWWTAGNPNNEYTPWGDYFADIDSLSASELAAFYDYLQSPGRSPLAAYAASRAYKSADYFNDLIGTKLIAEGRFAEAPAWLSRVPLSFISGQRVSVYMARRDFSIPRWERRQPVSEYDDDYRPIKATLTHNPKIKFCAYMNTLLSEYGVARPGTVREQTAYKLAAACYQASCYGDCWYLTRYYHSVADSTRAGEKDLAAQAAGYLRECAQSSDATMRYNALFALAAIDNEPWPDATDSDGSPKMLCDGPGQYDAYTRLARLLREEPDKAPAYVSKCDILRRFAASTAAY